MASLLEYHHLFYFTDILDTGRTIQSHVQDIADFPDVPWCDSFSNQLTYEYLGVDLDIVWKTIKTELPLLLDAAKTIISGEQTKESNRDAL